MKHILCVFALASLGQLSACRIVSGEVACRLDRDCPSEIPYCNAENPYDGGQGLCQEDAPPEEEDAGSAD